MKKFYFLIILCALITDALQAQHTRYIIRFRDKSGTPFSVSNPAAYLSQRSIERRTRYNISPDSTDLPVSPGYIDNVRNAGAVTILNVSKWLNQVSIQTTDQAALSKINSLPFVLSVAPIAARVNNTVDEDVKNKFKEDVYELGQRSSLASTRRSYNTAADYYNYGRSYAQVHIHNGEFLHNIGLRGQNMIIGMLDAGYLNYTSLRAFDSVRVNGQILDTYDFVARETSVVEDDAHGMMCFSIIAANIPGEFVGTAPKASFYLFRSEDAPTEYPIEEHNWVCAAERVDSAGGDVITSSIGYSDGMSDPAFNHTYAEMNGNTTIAAIGADLAAKKGILVLNGAGNQGTQPFHYISTPADGDSVLAVGAVNASGVVGSFSSYGPSSDGQVKPDVASVGVGTIIQSTNNTIAAGNGTSFACPNMAGLATCLWQGFLEFNNMKIANALRQAGSIATTPNDRIGFGIPDMRKATIILLKEFTKGSVSSADCRSTINWTSKDVASMKYEIERKAPGEANFTKVAERFGSGSVFATHVYQLTDTLVNVQAGTISYRIRQVIDTSAASFFADYLDTISVATNSSCITTGIDAVANNIEIILAPNPATNNVSLKVTTLNAVQNLHIRIADAAGKIVASLRESKPAGTTTIPVSIARFAKGKYYISIYNNGNLLATKELMKL
ncbi:MAG: S8 family serine peptidase [Chitinophagaceae bacterium]